MAPKFINQEKIQQMDHDLLIRLESKVDGLVIDIKDLKDGTSQKIADHEARLKVIELSHEKIDPEKAIEELHLASQWIHDFKLTWKITLGIAGGVGAAISFFIDLLLNSLKILK